MSKPCTTEGCINKTDLGYLFIAGDLDTRKLCDPCIKAVTDTMQPGEVYFMHHGSWVKVYWVMNREMILDWSKKDQFASAAGRPVKAYKHVLNRRGEINYPMCQGDIYLDRQINLWRYNVVIMDFIGISCVVSPLFENELDGIQSLVNMMPRHELT